jgi:Zn-dependent protease
VKNSNAALMRNWKISLTTEALVKSFFRHPSVSYISDSMSKAVVMPTDEPACFAVYQHPQGHTHVMVSVAPVSSAHDASMLQFNTCFEDGSNWVTLNRCRHFSPMHLANWTVFDDYLPHWQQALERHVARLKAASSPACVDSDEVQRRLYQSFEMLVPDMVARGELKTLAGSPHYRLSRWAALRFGVTALLGQWRAAKAVAGTQPAASPEPEALAGQRADADLQAFQNQEILRQAGFASARTRWLLFGLTALLFLVLGGWMFSWQLVPMVLAVVALHEAGHFLAMKLTGYRNLAVYFLPGLGGMATGEKAHASPMEKLFVYLAGPVPGLMLAGGAFWLTASGVWVGPPWLTQLLLVCLVVNYFNLLPVMPLDGGRVLEAMVFTRMPRLRFAFAGLGCAALLGLGVVLEDIVFSVVALLLALGLPQQWRVMQLDLAVSGQALEAGPADQSQALRLIFSALQLPRFQLWSYARRAAAASALLPQHLGRKPRRGETILGLAIYLGCLLAPLGALGLAMPQLGSVVALLAPAASFSADDVDPQSKPLPLPSVPDWEAQLANPAALSKDQLLQAYLGAAGQANDAENTELAQKHYQAAWDAAQALPARDLRRTDALEGLFLLAETDDEREAYASRILAELSEPQGIERAHVAWLKEQLAFNEPGAAARVQLLQDALALRTATPLADASAPSLLMTRLSLAKALDANQDSGQAQRVLQQRIDSLAQPASQDRSYQAMQVRIQRVLAQVDLAWFLIGHQRAVDAQAVAQQAQHELPAKLTVSWQQPGQLVWEAVVWAQLLATPTPALAEHWQAYERAKQAASFGSQKMVYHELDRALVGQALADTRLMAQGKAGVEEALARLSDMARANSTAPARPLPLCDPVRAREAASNWRAVQQEARHRMLIQLGGCGPQ